MENNNNNNQELRRLEKKAKTGWAAFYRSQRDLHDVIDSYIVDVRNLEQQIANHEGMPQHIMNELKELYEKMKNKFRVQSVGQNLKLMILISHLVDTNIVKIVSIKLRHNLILNVPSVAESYSN